jgi:GT2 family glycosyltransferase
MKSPKVSVVIPSWNGKENLKICLPSLFKQDFKDFEVILVDNSSTDGTVDFVRKNFPKTRVIVNKKNLGYTGAVNVGTKYSKAPYVAILTDDTKLDKRWLIEMLTALENQDSMAIAGCNIKNTSEVYNQSTLNSTINLLGEPVGIKLKNRLFTFVVSGCALLFEKKVIGQPFDPDYFAYSEDLYLSWLMRLKGYDVRIAPKSKLTHYGPKTSNKISEITEFHKEKNKIMNLLLLYEKKTLIKITPLLVSYIFLNLISSVFTGKFTLRIKSYSWLMANWKRLMLKREKIQKQRKVPDKEILKYMTYKIQHGLGVFDKLISGLIYIYCMLFNLKVYDLYIVKDTKH